MSFYKISLLSILVLLSVVTKTLGATNETLASECQAAVDAHNSAPCTVALLGKLDVAEANVTTKDDVDKLIDTFTASLGDYCSDKCAAEAKASFADVRDKCHLAANDRTPDLGLNLTVQGWQRNFLCSRSPNNTYCMVEVLTTMQPFIEKHPVASVVLTHSMVHGAADNSTTQQASNEMQTALAEAFSLPNDKFCAPCLRFRRQQEVILAGRVRTALGQQPLPIPPNVLGRINGKCGANWMTFDDSQFLLDQDVPPTLNATTASTPTDNSTKTAAAPTATVTVLGDKNGASALSSIASVAAIAALVVAL
ncbi:hypothetical protein RI367_007973 [Sorochytrium milnesiophthora]